MLDEKREEDRRAFAEIKASQQKIRDELAQGFGDLGAAVDGGFDRMDDRFDEVLQRIGDLEMDAKPAAASPQSPQEGPSSDDVLFDLIDLNKDGKISKEELMLYLLGKGCEIDTVSSMFLALDINRNNEISRAEFRAGAGKFAAMIGMPAERAKEKQGPKHFVARACLTTLEGHTNLVYAVCCLDGGKRLASGSADKNVKIWDASGKGECLLTLKGHKNDVRCVCSLYGGTQVASGSADKTVRLWDTRKGDACLHTLEGHTKYVMSVCSFDGGARLASGSTDGTVKLWDAQNGACLQTLEGGSDDVYSVCSFDGGTQIASGDGDDKIKLWG